MSINKTIKDIITGHVNEALNRGEQLSNDRLLTCSTCPLLTHNTFGPICNPSLYLNVEDNTTSEVPKEGYKRGCGCRLNAKTRVEDATCPLGKW